MSLLGLDVGTTGCKAVVFSSDGIIHTQAYKEYDLLYSGKGRVEFDSRRVMEIIKDIIRDAASKTTSDPITAMSVSSCGEAMTPVSGDRKILDNAILGFDERGLEYLPLILSRIGAKEVFNISGNKPAAFFSAPKLMWYKEYKPEVYDNARYFLSWPDLIFFLLGCEPVIDYSLANRTLLFDIENKIWSDKIINSTGLAREKLPDVAPSGIDIGVISDKIADELGLRRGVHCVTGGHDQCCNAIGAGANRSGQAAYGIGTFICITLTYSRKPDKDILFKNNLNLEHHVVPGQYVSFVYNTTGGSVLKWFRDEFSALEKETAKREGTDIYSDLIKNIPDCPTNLLVIPYFAPTGAPRFDMNTPGAILGLRLETSRWQVLKALMEGVTYYFADSINSFHETSMNIEEYRPTGGGAKSDIWLQIKADIMGKPFKRPKIIEASCLGAALLAGTATGVYDNLNQAVDNLVKIDKVFEPDGEKHSIYLEKMEMYKKMLNTISDFTFKDNKIYE